MLKLQSSDGVVFELTDEIAKQSIVIKDMLQITDGQNEGILKSWHVFDLHFSGPTKPTNPTENAFEY